MAEITFKKYPISLEKKMFPSYLDEMPRGKGSRRETLFTFDEFEEMMALIEN